jgi:hypothetical protein
MNGKRERAREMEEEERRGRKRHSLPSDVNKAVQAQNSDFYPHCDMCILCPFPYPSLLLRSTGSLQRIASNVICTAPYSKLD